MFTTSFQKETFHCKSFIRSFQEWVWIKSMSKMISLSKGMEEQAIYLTRWTIQPLFCGKLLVPKLPEFEDFMDRNKNLTESSTKHCEDSQTFRKRFSFHVDRLIKCTTVNPFMQDHLTKLNNNKIIVREFMRSVINDFEAMGEKQLANLYLPHWLWGRYNFTKNYLKPNRNMKL